MSPDDLDEQLIDPAATLSVDEFWAERRHLPVTGIYAWWFEGLEHLVPHEGTVGDGTRSMLYIGIAPARAGSRSTLRRRLSQHLSGNASASTLRLTLGVLLAGDLGLELRRVGGGGRMTFHCGQAILTSWLERHARVRPMAFDAPWTVERSIIERFALPLNLQHNAHPFGDQLAAMRSAARRGARMSAADPDCCANT